MTISTGIYKARDDDRYRTCTDCAKCIVTEKQPENSYKCTGWVSIVNGEDVGCFGARIDDTMCGQTARHFIPKTKKGPWPNSLEFKDRKGGTVYLHDGPLPEGIRDGAA